MAWVSESTVEGEAVFPECFGRGNVPVVARVEADRALHGQQVQPPQPVRAPCQEPRRAAARIAWMIDHRDVPLLTHPRLWATLVGTHHVVHLRAGYYVASYHRPCLGRVEIEIGRPVVGGHGGEVSHDRLERRRSCTGVGHYRGDGPVVAVP